MDNQVPPPDLSNESLSTPEQPISPHRHKLVYVCVLLLLVTAALILGILFFPRYTAPTTTTPARVTNPAGATDPYTGWKTYCATAVAACIHYPTDWTGSAGSPGAFVNPTSTTQVSLIPWTNQNQTPNLAYIYSITSLATSATPLDIVGYIVSDQPGYVVYDASYVAAKGMTVNTTERVVDGNYAFSGKKVTISLVATPYADAYTAITTLSQAKAWFASPDGQTDLRILQSLYYQ